jgi:hypothetical protein
MPQLADTTRGHAEREIESLQSMSDQLVQFIESAKTDHQNLIDGNKENLEKQKALLVELEAEEEQAKSAPSTQYTEEEKEDLLKRRHALIDVTKETIEHLPTLISEQEGQEEDERTAAARRVLQQVEELLSGFRTSLEKDDEDQVQARLDDPELNTISVTVSNVMDGAGGADG